MPPIHRDIDRSVLVEEAGVELFLFCFVLAELDMVLVLFLFFCFPAIFRPVYGCITGKQSEEQLWDIWLVGRERR